MKRLSLPALAVLASCAGDYSWRSEGYNEFYRQPYGKAERANLERKKIMHWTTNPRLKKRLGVLERNEVILEGSRAPRDHWTILDSHFETVGFITAEGKFYRFDHRAERHLVGEYPIQDDPDRRMFMTGLKVFFGLPLTDNLSLDDIDPYGDF
jgi:hypothetical protein